MKEQIKIERLTWGTMIGAKVRDYSALIKFRLSLLVVFSSAIGYLMGSDHNWDWFHLNILMLGGLLVTGASNALNQVIEKEEDRLMMRTQNRPLPAGRMTITEAVLAAGIMGVSGLLIFWFYFNAMAAFFSALALMMYAFIYTPMKRFSSTAVFIGAIPGALPVLIGVVCATNQLTALAFVLFAIQFLWQFPHFWAIAWVAYDDYLRAGFHLLPSKEGRTKFSALMTVFYCIALLLAGVIPFLLGLTGIDSLVIVTICGIIFLVQSMRLLKSGTVEAARQLMFASFFYLPIAQLALYFDKL